ncbi:MAG: hypothetical protein WCK89_15665, partial [bacterium]
NRALPAPRGAHLVCQSTKVNRPAPFFIDFVPQIIDYTKFETRGGIYPQGPAGQFSIFIKPCNGLT